jgi:SAM-dependent methyltransferase
LDCDSVRGLALTEQEKDRLLAYYYRLEYAGYTDDLDFYVQSASFFDPEKAYPVLELGCGTGRVLLQLAEAGFDVTGVDASAAMLELCRAEAKKCDLSDKVTLVQSDMRDLKSLVAGSYNLAFCALNTFAYLQTREDQLAMLRGVHAALVQHGLLILDLTPPFPHFLVPSDGELVHQGSYYDEVDGITLHKLVTGVVDHATQEHHVTILYDREAQDGTLSRLTHRVALRWTGLYEMELLLQLAGYRVEKIYGGYELEEYDQNCERLIFVARRM